MYASTSLLITGIYMELYAYGMHASKRVPGMDRPSSLLYMCPRGAPHQYDKSNGATAECTGKTLVRMRSDVYLWGFCMSIVS